jgi:hypothetical protein
MIVATSHRLNTKRRHPDSGQRAHVAVQFRLIGRQSLNRPAKPFELGLSDYRSIGKQAAMSWSVRI